MERFFHSVYRRFKFLEKYLEKYLKEKELIKVLNFIDLKIIDKEYILVLFVIWFFFFILFLLLYLIILIIKPSIFLNVIIYTQLFLGFFILISYIYPFYKAKLKLNKIKQEFYPFLDYVYLLSTSRLNFNEIMVFLLSLNKKEINFPTILEELRRIHKISKLQSISLENSIKLFLQDYPDCDFKKFLLQLLNIKTEKGEIRDFINSIFKKVNKDKKLKEKKFYEKLDLIIVIYLIFLLIFPFFLILLLFIFDIVDKMMVAISQTQKEDFYFLNALFFLLIFLPISYMILYLIIDYLIPLHSKIRRK